jgi:hypothetical protein
MAESMVFALTSPPGCRCLDENPSPVEQCKAVATVNDFVVSGCDPKRTVAQNLIGGTGV